MSAGILMVPATAHAEQVIGGPGQSQNAGGNSCSNESGSVVAKPTPVNGHADSGSSSIGFDPSDLESLLKSITAGFKSGM
ncbi:hypothetical protein [Rhodococcus sp. NPDC127528]|uniref:hypothetical protein n=1 Tax=unclassified Rhodococcus (in: high G+C Gram-positive bacteria) TaxID=192944 RepID=UPI003639E90E